MGNKIIVATKNRGKVQEIRKLFNKYDIEIEGIVSDHIIAPEETGSSFQENAEIKSRYYSLHTGCSVLSDDSGFCIDLLDGFPGIHSRRIALGINGEEDYNQAFRLINHKLNDRGVNVEEDDIRANFQSVISYFDVSTQKTYNIQGIVTGKFLVTPRGSRGFGYDPVFIPDGYKDTFAEMDLEKKNLCSHRGQALSKFLEFFTNL